MLTFLSGCVVVIMGMMRNCRFTAEEVTGQNQVKASVQRKIRQSIADEVNATTNSVLHRRYETLKLIFIWFLYLIWGFSFSCFLGVGRGWLFLWNWKLFSFFLFHNLTNPEDTKTLAVYVQYPDLEPLLEDMLPKKAPLIVAKWCASITLLQP